MSDLFKTLTDIFYEPIKWESVMDRSKADSMLSNCPWEEREVQKREHVVTVSMYVDAIDDEDAEEQVKAALSSTTYKSIFVYDIEEIKEA